MKCRLSDDSVTVYVEPSNTSAVVAELKRGDFMELGQVINPGAEAWVEVTLPDQRKGYVLGTVQLTEVLARSQSLGKAFEALVTLLCGVWLLGVSVAPQKFMLNDWINPGASSKEFPNPPKTDGEHCLVPGCYRAGCIDSGGKEGSFCTVHKDGGLLNAFYGLVALFTGEAFPGVFVYVMRLALISFCLKYLRDLGYYLYSARQGPNYPSPPAGKTS
ncbi:MAG: SH3 domain-containing protein [Verrucomicrobiaceae bacterium]|nr:SH3 domain-containing protein [Verrucomicrobiaceae bacterium]